MRLVQLEYFEAVARNLSFTKAADECHVAQPAISQQIQALEHELGFILFNRSRHEVVLTGAGRIYYQQTAGLVEKFHAARQRALAVSKGIEGELCFGVAGSTQSDDMRAIAEFHKCNPPIGLSFRHASTGRQHEQLMKGEFEVYFTATDCYSGNPSIRVVASRENALCVFVHRDNPLARLSSVSWAELSRFPCIFADSQSDGPGLMPGLSVEDRSSLDIVKAEDQDIAWFMLRLNMGVLLAPKSILPSKQDDIIALDLNEGNPCLQTGWVSLRHNDNPALGMFLDFVEQRELRTRNGKVSSRRDR